MIVTRSNRAAGIRQLELRDIPSAMELSSAAGWNQTPEDWTLLLTMAPDSCFALEVDGSIAATSTLVCYGQRLAWLGMVLTRAEYQGRGYARRLVERALAEADRRAIPTVKLDATEQGIRLYSNLGFRVEQDVERWIGRGVKVSSKAHAAQPSDPLIPSLLDEESMGVNRSRLIHLLSAREQPIVAEHGFVMHRPGLRARYLGPSAAPSAFIAGQLAEQCLASDAGYWFWDILPANRDAARVASDLHFKPERQLVRMVRGADLNADSSRLFAIAGFEIG